MNYTNIDGTFIIRNDSYRLNVNKDIIDIYI